MDEGRRGLSLSSGMWLYEYQYICESYSSLFQGCNNILTWFWKRPQFLKKGICISMNIKSQTNISTFPLPTELIITTEMQNFECKRTEIYLMYSPCIATYIIASLCNILLDPETCKTLSISVILSSILSLTLSWGLKYWKAWSLEIPLVSNSLQLLIGLRGEGHVTYQRDDICFL